MDQTIPNSNRSLPPTPSTIETGGRFINHNPSAIPFSLQGYQGYQTTQNIPNQATSGHSSSNLASNTVAAGSRVQKRSKRAPSETPHKNSPRTRGKQFSLANNATVDLIPMIVGQVNESKLSITLTPTDGSAPVTYEYPHKEGFEFSNQIAITEANKWRRQIFRRRLKINTEMRRKWTEDDKNLIRNHPEFDSPRMSENAINELNILLTGRTTTSIRAQVDRLKREDAINSGNIAVVIRKGYDGGVQDILGDSAAVDAQLETHAYEEYSGDGNDYDYGGYLEDECGIDEELSGKEGVLGYNDNGYY